MLHGNLRFKTGATSRVAPPPGIGIPKQGVHNTFPTLDLSNLFAPPEPAATGAVHRVKVNNNTFLGHPDWPYIRPKPSFVAMAIVF